MKSKHLKSTNLLGGICLSAVVVISGCASIPAPTEQIAVSKMAVSNASSAGGNEFAPVPLKSAMEKLDSAERAVADDNNFLATQLAEQSQVDAQLSTATARAAKAQKAVSELQEGNRVLRQEIERKAQ